MHQVKIQVVQFQVRQRSVQEVFHSFAGHAIRRQFARYEKLLSGNSRQSRADRPANLLLIFVEKCRIEVAIADVDCLLHHAVDQGQVMLRFKSNFRLEGSLGRKAAVSHLHCRYRMRRSVWSGHCSI